MSLIYASLWAVLTILKEPVMLLCLLLLGGFGLFMFISVLLQLRKPVLSLYHNGYSPNLDLPKGLKWHAYVSYHWLTGQAEAEQLQHSLEVLLPEICVICGSSGEFSPEERVQAIRQCAQFVVLLTHDYFHNLQALGELSLAVELGKELFEERLDQVWPDRKKADLSGESGSDMPPPAGGDDRIALLNTLEEKALKNAHGVYLIGPTARRAAANGGYRPQCPAEPVEGLPPECPSPTALSRLADDLDVEGARAMMEEEAPTYEEAATIGGVEVDSGDDDGE